MKTPTRHWTEEELTVIGQEYNGTGRSRQNLAERFGVTQWQIGTALKKLGRLLSNDQQRRWTPQEDEQLKQLIPQFSSFLISNRLQRTENAVVTRIKHLGLSKRDRKGWYTLNEVSSLLGKDHHWIRRRLDNGELTGVRYFHDRRPEEQQDQTGTKWKIEKEDLRTFIRQYADQLDGCKVNVPALVRLLTGPIPQEDLASPEAFESFEPDQKHWKPGQSVTYNDHIGIFHYSIGKNRAAVSFEDDIIWTVPRSMLKTLPTTIKN